jgi:hypothetical protein
MIPMRIRALLSGMVQKIFVEDRFRQVERQDFKDKIVVAEKDVVR